MRFPWLAFALVCAMYFAVGFAAHAALSGELAAVARHPAGPALLGAVWLGIVTDRFVRAVRAWQTRARTVDGPAA